MQITYCICNIVHIPVGVLQQEGCLSEALFLHQLRIVLPGLASDFPGEAVQIIMQLLRQLRQASGCIPGFNVGKRLKDNCLLRVRSIQCFRMTHQLHKEQSHGQLAHFSLAGHFLKECKQQILNQILNRRNFCNLKMQKARTTALSAEAIHQKAAQWGVLPRP